MIAEFFLTNLHYNLYAAGMECGKYMISSHPSNYIGLIVIKLTNTSYVILM